MELLKRAGEVTPEVIARLEEIRPSNGYFTDLKGVYGPGKTVPDKAALPYVQVRPGVDRRTSFAASQAVRVREYELEGFFSSAASEEELAAFHVDALRALGVGQDQTERAVPGLVDEEEEAEYRWAIKGETTSGITIRLGVQYVQSYN